MDWPTILTLGATIIGTGIMLGVSLIAIIVPGQREMRQEIRSLSDRVSRIEGFLQGRMGVASEIEHSRQMETP